MSKSVKRVMLNSMKHAQYDADMARHNAKRSFVQNESRDKYFKKYKKFDQYIEDE